MGNIRLLVGLGNPGREYANTYHNAGAQFIDWLAAGVKFKKQKLFLVARLPNGAYVAKPAIFMNESGRAVQAALSYLKITPDELLVAHDDSDIMLGECRMSFDRGGAGHNGVQSVIHTLGTQEFYRLRIGIRPPISVNPRSNQGRSASRVKAGDFVLKKITPAHKKILADVFTHAFSEILPNS